jgi:hypothetical protein
MKREKERERKKERERENEKEKERHEQNTFITHTYYGFSGDSRARFTCKKLPGQLCPSVAMYLVQLPDDRVFYFCPRILPNLRVQLVVPPT